MADMTPEERKAFDYAADRIAQAEREGWTELNLSGIGLTKLPSVISRLTNLQQLNLGFNPKTRTRNQLTCASNALRKLTQLKYLNLNYNKLTVVSDWLSKLTQLQTLDLSSNLITDIPVWLGGLAQLQNLDLSGNQLTVVPDSLRELIKLQVLNLAHNDLEIVPPFLCELTKLQILNLRYNQLATIPDSLRALTQLKALHLSFNRLEFVPDWLNEMIQLKTLYLNNNKLTTVPDFLGKLTQLEKLGLGDSGLIVVPHFLRELTQLKKLYLWDNKLTNIPDWLTKMSQLKELYINDNPITQPPPEHLGNALTDYNPVDLEAIRRYYAQLRRAGQAYFYEAKLLLIGEGGAGKTSLARKLLAPTAPLPLPKDSTEGIDILNWQFPIPAEQRQDQDQTGFENLSGLDTPQYQVNIWDFGGQSVYHATHQFFLSKRSVYVLLTDTRRQLTDFYDWLRMQETFGENSPILLLKNKNRQHGNQCVIENLPHLRDRFPNLGDIIELDLNNVPDDPEWPTLLRHLQKRLLALDHIGVARPKTWVAVRQALNGDERDSISRRQFLALCHDHDITDPADALQLSDYLHHVGDILHFEDDPILADLVILKPTWALDAVYRVLDNEEIGASWGQFSRQQLHELWHEAKYDNHREQLLRLMQKFKLCYELDQDSFIAPQLLQPEAPIYDWDGEADDLQLRYRYPLFMPRGILSRAIVALHHRIEDQRLVWRSGVILRDEFAHAEMLELRGDREIRIRVSGGNKRDLLMEIVRGLDELHRGFSSKLKYEKLVPCRCETCRPSSDPHFFALGKLLERLSHRKETIECNNAPYAEVQIRSLIDDAILQTELRGDIHVSGDYINVGDIKDGRGIAIGRRASGSATQTPK